MLNRLKSCIVKMFMWIMGEDPDDNGEWLEEIN